MRNTRYVDILLARPHFEEAKAALERAGFTYLHVRGLDIFRDGPDSKVRDSVHVLFASEKMTGDELVANPDIDESVRGDLFQVLSLEALVRTKLNAWRDKDRTHLRDMLDVELIDQSWVQRFPPELGQRLQYLIDNPE